MISEGSGRHGGGMNDEGKLSSAYSKWVSFIEILY